MIHIKGYIGNGIEDKKNGIEKEFSLLDLVEQVQKETGDTIHVLIDSAGGNLDVGFSMYEYLLSLDKVVVTECVNTCASAATLPFIAGIKRIAGCPIMIHNPYLEDVSGDGELLRAAADFLEEKEKQAEKIYSERTKVDAQTLSELMKSDTYMSPSQAVSLGFATEAKQVVLAKIDKSNINKKETKMSKPERGLGEQIKDLLFGKRAQAKGKDPVVYNMDLGTSDGSTLYVDREEGSPQVGDKASPDGTFIMPDGSVITVVDGVITDITGVESSEEEVTEEEVDKVVTTIEELVQERDELLEENEKLKEEAVQARAVMNAIKMAGGYDKVFGKFKTNYKPQARSGQRGNKQEVQRESETARMLADAKEKRNKK